MRSIIILFAISLAAAHTATATPVDFRLEDPGSSYIAIKLLAIEQLDTLPLVDTQEVPIGGQASAELLGTIIPGYDVFNFSLGWNNLNYSGNVPNVGPFELAFDPFEISFLGDPLLNIRGRVQPNTPRVFQAPMSTGSPAGTLTVAGTSVDFDLGSFDCAIPIWGNNCFTHLSPPQAEIRTTDLTDLAFYGGSTIPATPPLTQDVLTVGNVTFRVTVEQVFVQGAEYAIVPEPNTAALIGAGVLLLSASRRSRPA